MKFNTIWIASVPRTGSMWTTNVIREIHKISEFNVFPKNMIQLEKDWFNFYNDNAPFDKNELNRYVIKIHSKLTVIPPRSKIVVNIRNPYEICASYKDFMKCNLEKSINVAVNLSNWIKYYKNLEKNILYIKYEHIENNAKDVIANLAKFCEIELTSNQNEYINSKYSKKNIQEIIKKNDNEIKYQKNENLLINEKKIVKFQDGSYRSFDLNTGFQSGHISQRKTGEWNKMFTIEEKKIIIDKLDPIAIELGYNSEKTN